MSISWYEASGSASDKNVISSGSFSGTQAPVLSPQWNTAYGNAAGNLNGGGATAGQQSAMDFAKNQMSFTGYDANGNLINPATAALQNANTNLQPLKTQLGTIGDQFGAAAGTSPLTSTALTSAAPPSINSATTASAMAPYSQLYSQELIDPSLAALDYGTNRAFTALDARTAGGGGFANSRSGVNYGDLGTQSALQRGQLEAQLKNLGLTNAAGYATGDVTRQQGADTQNAANIMGTNEFNANLGTSNNQFNVNAGIQQRQLSDTERTSQTAAIAQQAGLTQQQAANIVTANGINTEAAAALFQAGQITQQQLLAITQAAQAANGQTAQGTSNSNTNTTDVSGSVGFK